MLLNLLACAVGLILLVWSADRFVRGAASIARHLGAPPLLIGLTIIGIGTSAPEVVVSLIASLQGNPQIAVGNALGSNITNIGMVLGVTALIAPLAVSSTALRRELPLVLGVSIATLLMCLDGLLERWNGALLLMGFVATMAWMIWLGRTTDASDPLIQEISQEGQTAALTPRWAYFWIVTGLILLPVSSQMLVFGATRIAEHFGVSDLVIGLTVIAIGTSLPELAATVAGALHKEPDLAVGNVLGSNLFNLLLVLGIPGVIAAPQLDPAVIVRDLPMMIGLTVAVIAMAWGRSSPGRISRIEGAALLAAFIGYELILAASVDLI